MDEALIELQTKLAFQEDLLEQLNEVVTQQQAHISRLEQQIDRLRVQMQVVQAALPEPGKPQDEIPPHY